MLSRSCLEIHYNFISKYETDKNEPPLMVLLASARLTGIPVECLIDDKLDLPVVTLEL